MPRRRNPGWWVGTLVLMLAITGLSHQPKPLGLGWPHPQDWLAHFFTYLALGFLLARATGRWPLALVLAAWFGALDEVHQAFIPGREAGIQDWLFDLLGAWGGSFLSERQPWVRKPKARPAVIDVDLTN